MNIRLYKELRSLFSQDEQSLNSFRRSVTFEFHGTSSDAITNIKSLAHHTTFTKIFQNEIHQIPLRSIIWTDHPSYQCFWNLQEKVFTGDYFMGQRNPGEAGTKTGWAKRENSSDDYISLSKHPERDEYVISGDGNNRVMKSLTTPGSLLNIWADVADLTWLPHTRNLIQFLNQSKPFEVSIQISDKLNLGIRRFHDSRMYYIQVPWSEKNSLEEELTTDENILKDHIPNWTHIGFKTKLKVIWELIKLNF